MAKSSETWNDKVERLVRENPPIESDDFAWLATQVNDGLTPAQEKFLVGLDNGREILHDISWFIKFDEIRSYEAEHGKLPGGKLGQWMADQRRAEAKSTLSTRRARALSSLPNWSWDPVRDRWMESWRRLRDYVGTHGVTPKREDDHQLWTWMLHQRMRHRANKLDAERVDLLESVPGWEWEYQGHTRSRSAWTLRFEQVKAFVWEHRRLPSSAADDEHEADLGAWLNQQRTQHRRDPISAYRVSALESLPNWTWNPREDAWDRSLIELKRALDSGEKVTAPGHKLRPWVTYQRAKHRKGKLGQNRAMKLRELQIL